jgi:L-aspartate oxidase
VFAACLAAASIRACSRSRSAPACHYHMGGIATDADGRTTSCRASTPAGECASTACHGANRLASNSLLEAAVFGARAARRRHAGGARPGRPRRSTARPAPAALQALRQAMSRDAGVVRDAEGLAACST